MKDPRADGVKFKPQEAKLSTPQRSSNAETSEKARKVKETAAAETMSEHWSRIQEGP